MPPSPQRKKASALGTLLGGTAPAARQQAPPVRPAAVRGHAKPPSDAAAFLAQAFGLDSLDDPDPPTFLPSSKFTGARAGWVFKDGDFGVGYYVTPRRPKELRFRRPDQFSDFIDSW